MNHIGFDWDRAWRYGRSIAGDYHRSTTTIGDHEIMWALLCDAAAVAETFPAASGRGYPQKSAWPDFPDQVTAWQLMAAYVRGEVEEMPEADPPKIQPSAEDISRTWAVLDLWHSAVTLGVKRKRAVFLAACRKRPRLIQRIAGVGAQELKNAKRRSVDEMLKRLEVH